MSRYTDARAGFQKPAQEAAQQARRYNPQDTQRIKEYFSAGHPLQKLSRERQQRIYTEDLCGGKVDVALNLLEVMMAEGATFLRRAGDCPSEATSGAERVDCPRPTTGPATTGDSPHGPQQPGPGTVPSKRPPYTAATLVRAASEMRKLLDKRDALMDEAMRRVAEEWMLAQQQLEMALTSQRFPEGELTPEEALAAYHSQFTRPDAHAPPG